MEKRSQASYEKKKKYITEYQKTNYKRVPLDLTIPQYEAVKAAATNAGETVNGYIKKAITDRINRQ